MQDNRNYVCKIRFTEWIQHWFYSKYWKLSFWLLNCIAISSSFFFFWKVNQNELKPNFKQNPPVFRSFQLLQSNSNPEFVSVEGKKIQIWKWFGVSSSALNAPISMATALDWSFKNNNTHAYNDMRYSNTIDFSHTCATTIAHNK